MLVKYWMSAPAIVTSPNAPAAEAAKLMRQRGIRMLPVVAGSELVGVVTERDLKKASPAKGTPLETYELLELVSEIKVKSVMARNPVTARPEESIEEIAERLLTLRISGVPVIGPGGGLLGVITRSDIFRALISLTGAGKGGIQFALTMVDRPGCIKTVTNIIRQFGGRLVSTLSSYERVSPGYRRVYLRMNGIDRPSLERIRELISQHATILYIVDPQNGIREIRC
ncbi:MAG: CBS and ACT domain-containing protein [Pseudomonadota bacterium]